MKYPWLLLMYFVATLAAATSNPHSLPTGAIGLLQVDRLTQGELLWMQGRVGEGVYTTLNPAGQHCAIKVPVAVGRVEKSGVGIASVSGLSIIVMNPQLSAALISGERVRSDEWSFAWGVSQRAADGYVIGGIGEHEGFVLNSKRRWISWFLQEKPALQCQ